MSTRTQVRDKRAHAQQIIACTTDSSGNRGTKVEARDEQRKRACLAGFVCQMLAAGKCAARMLVVRPFS